jgi:hypothetical protein
MDNNDSIPVFMVGRSAENAKVLLPKLDSRFDGPSCLPLSLHCSRCQTTLLGQLADADAVVQFCTSTVTAREELLSALQGKEVRDPSTTLGSNARRGAQPRKPAAIFVGAGFAKEDYEAFRRDVHDATGGTVWVREEKTDVEGLDDPSNWVVREGVGRVPKPEVLIRSISKCLMRDLGAQ